MNEKDAGDGITTGNDNVCVGTLSGTAITTGTNIITIGAVTGVHSIFGEVDNTTYIANILGAAVDVKTAQLVYVDSDGRLGTVLTDGAERNAPGVHPKGVRPQAIPDAAKQATLNRKIRTLQQQVETLTAQLKEQAAEIQKVNAQLEINKPASKVVVDKP